MRRMVLGSLATLAVLAASEIGIPTKRPPLAPAADGKPPSTCSNAESSPDTDSIVAALARTTLLDFELLERLGAAPLVGGGFVGANAAVYRARCIATSCRTTFNTSALHFAVKVMFRPEPSLQDDWGQDSGADLKCTVAPNSGTESVTFASPAERIELTLQGRTVKPARLAHCRALLPIYHCFVDAVDPGRLPDWNADSSAETAHTGGGNVGQVPRGAKATLFFVMPLTGPNLHHHATQIIHNRLATATKRKQQRGSPEPLTADEVQQIQALPVLSTIGWVSLAAQLAAGLAHLAEAKIAHRDVKLDNILLASGSVEQSGVMHDDLPAFMLTDFGAALDARAAVQLSANVPPVSGSHQSTPLRVPATSSLVRVVGGVNRRGGNPYNLPPEVLFASIESTDQDDTPYIDYTGTDSWGLGTVMHELVAPTVEPWPGLRMATSPFNFSFEADRYQILRASFRPTRPKHLIREAEWLETEFSIGIAVIAAGLVDKCLLLSNAQPTRGDRSPIRLPIKEAREDFAALLLLLWWEKQGGRDEATNDGSKSSKHTKTSSSQPGWPEVQLGPPLALVQRIVAAAQAQLSSEPDGALGKVSSTAGQCERQSKTGGSNDPWWVLREYLAREPAVIIHQRISWLYDVYGAGLSPAWPHVAEGAVWPPVDGPWKLPHEKRRSEPETTFKGALGGRDGVQS